MLYGIDVEVVDQGTISEKIEVAVKTADLSRKHRCHVAELFETVYLAHVEFDYVGNLDEAASHVKMKFSETGLSPESALIGDDEYIFKFDVNAIDVAEIVYGISDPFKVLVVGDSSRIGSKSQERRYARYFDFVLNCDAMAATRTYDAVRKTKEWRPDLVVFTPDGPFDYDWTKVMEELANYGGKSVIYSKEPEHLVLERRFGWKVFMPGQLIDLERQFIPNRWGKSFWYPGMDDDIKSV